MRDLIRLIFIRFILVVLIVRISVGGMPYEAMLDILTKEIVAKLKEHGLRHGRSGQVGKYREYLLLLA